MGRTPLETLRPVVAQLGSDTSDGDGAGRMVVLEVLGGALGLMRTVAVGL